MNHNPQTQIKLVLTFCDQIWIAKGGEFLCKLLIGVIDAFEQCDWLPETFSLVRKEQQHNAGLSCEAISI